MNKIYNKSIALTFRGFGASTTDVENLMAVAATHNREKGARASPASERTLARSVVSFELDLASDCRLDEMLCALLKHVGGLDHICKVRDEIQPEYFEIDIMLPIKGSDEQDNGYFSLEDIENIYAMRATLGLSFAWKEGYTDRVLAFLDSAPSN